jgi:hypothetical protein
MQFIQEVPFLLEDRIRLLGGKYEKHSDLWGVSQNPVLSP